MSEVTADMKKKALCWTRYMSDSLLDPGTRPKETGILFRLFWFCGDRCSHIEGARHIEIPEVS